MPVTFNQIAQNTASVTVQIKNLGPVTIEYYPNKLTDKYAAQIEAGSVDDNQILIDLIKSWDIYKDDTEVPFTVKWPLLRVETFGYPVTHQVVRGLSIRAIGSNPASQR